MATVERSDICDLWHRSVQIDRATIFGPADEEKYRPKHLRDDSATMFAGYVGRRYRPGKGVVLLAINPGGGGDACERRRLEDRRFYPLLQAFKDAPSSDAMDAFERVNECFVSIVKDWNIWNIIRPTLEAADRTLDEAAYMNLVPYRTRNDKSPPVEARKASLRRIVRPALDILAPDAVIALGEEAGKIVNVWQPPPAIRLSSDVRFYCVPRTRGDRSVSESAKDVLVAMQNEPV